MKPLYSDKVRLSRCHCCQSKNSKHNSGGSKRGNSSARQRAKKEIKDGT